MHGTATFIADLAIVLCVAAATSVLSRAARQPTILGYLFAGLIVGPYLPIPVFADPERVRSLSELGVILVMFAIGLEFNIKKLMRVLPTAGVTGLVQVSLLVWAGFTLGRWMGWSPVSALFLGTSLSISSTMVVSRLLDPQRVGRGARDLVLGVLVVQDVIAIALIAAMTAVAAGGRVSAEELLSTVGRLAGVLAAMVGMGMLVVPRLVRAVRRMGSDETLVVVIGGICFGLALLAERLGYSVALGAFIAGVLVSESGEAHEVEPQVQPMRDMFAAVFFVSIGMTVDPLVAWQHLGTSLGVAALIIIGQLLSVTLAGVLSGNGLGRSVTAGLALGQIGEFAFILAGIGAAAGVVDPALQTILVTVSVLTTFSTPLLLGVSTRVVGLLDRLLPPRLQDLLSLYESGFERLRLSPTVKSSPGRRALRAIVLDALLLIALAVLEALLSPKLLTLLREHTALSAPWDGLAVAAVGLLLGLPPLVGLARSTRVFARLTASSLIQHEEGSSPTPIGQLVEGAIVLLVIAAVGFPAMAVLRPFLSGPYGVPVLAVALLATGYTLWRSAGRADAELRSGAEQLLALVADQGSAQEGPDASSLAFKGLNTLTLGQASPAIGRTLGELNLRAVTGVAVVAIHRKTGTVTVPHASERLQVGDTLALVGTPESRERAQDLLQPGSPSPSNTSPGQ